MNIDHLLQYKSIENEVEKELDRIHTSVVFNNIMKINIKKQASKAFKRLYEYCEIESKNLKLILTPDKETCLLVYQALSFTKNNELCELKNRDTKLSDKKIEEVLNTLNDNFKNKKFNKKKIKNHLNTYELKNPDNILNDFDTTLWFINNLSDTIIYKQIIAERFKNNIVEYNANSKIFTDVLDLGIENAMLLESYVIAYTLPIRMTSEYKDNLMDIIKSNYLLIMSNEDKEDNE